MSLMPPPPPFFLRHHEVDIRGLSELTQPHWIIILRNVRPPTSGWIVVTLMIPWRSLISVSWAKKWRPPLLCFVFSADLGMLPVKRQHVSNKLTAESKSRRLQTLSCCRFIQFLQGLNKRVQSIVAKWRGRRRRPYRATLAVSLCFQSLCHAKLTILLL